jgi:hypothetical protein
MAQKPGPPPSQRQQAKQSPVLSHWQHQTGGEQHGVGQLVVTPLQVTCPLSLTEQSRSTATQVPPAPETEQVTVPDAQFAVALQDL